MAAQARPLPARDSRVRSADEPTVYIVDDNDADRDWLRSIAESVGLRTATYSSARDFLAAYLPSSPGCLVLDLRMPRMDGLDLQEELNRRGVRIPVLFVTAYGEVSSAVRAMRGGAVDFMLKTCGERDLLRRIEEALRLDAERRGEEAEQEEIGRRFDGLSPREQEVLRHVVLGEPSKAIADVLDISVRTVDVHRANIMRKLKTHSIPELCRMVSRRLPDTHPHGPHKENA